MDMYIIDRFEGKYAVMEKNGDEIVDVKRSKLPKNVRQGSVLRFENGVFTQDFEEEARRRKLVREI